ncbi:MAG: hypothetical protein JWQ27_1764, partial [Ferruginibacter sp.]|nr:hypothetical protein [Ferruginibacter sp.]
MLLSDDQDALHKEKAPAFKLGLLADRTGLEPATSAVTGQHSNQLNYRSFSLFALRNHR